MSKDVVLKFITTTCENYDAATVQVALSTEEWTTCDAKLMDELSLTYYFFHLALRTKRFVSRLNYRGVFENPISLIKKRSCDVVVNKISLVTSVPWKKVSHNSDGNLISWIDALTSIVVKGLVDSKVTLLTKLFQCDCFHIAYYEKHILQLQYLSWCHKDYANRMLWHAGN